jgi:hypothetical protein
MDDKSVLPVPQGAVLELDPGLEAGDCGSKHDRQANEIPCSVHMKVLPK